MAHEAVIGVKRKWLAAFVSVLLLVATACVPGGQMPPASATAPVTAPATAPFAATKSSSWYHLYFTNPFVTAQLSNPAGGIPDKIAAGFDDAQHTIDVAIYQLDLMPLAEALVRAHQRGVQIRVVTDSDSLDMDGIQALVKAAVPVVPDKRLAIMHDKLSVT